MHAAYIPKVPVEDSAYRYPPSKNPYWEKLKATSPYGFSDHETENHRGEWRSRFQAPLANAPLHVEIGCNAGHVLTEWAKKNPEIAYIGIDWKMKAIHRGMEKAHKHGLKNAIYLRGHAGRLHYIFAPNEIDRLHLFFPDPWPKKSDWKHRFFTAERLRMVTPLVKVGGIFEIKTDHAGYFEWMEKALATFQAEHGKPWEIEFRSANLHENHPNPQSLTIPEVTLFERLFIKDGLPIHRLVLRRMH